MFVRAKRHAGKTYYSLVESRRKGGRVRQRTVCYLGQYPTVDAAVAGLRDERDAAERAAVAYRRDLAALPPPARPLPPGARAVPTGLGVTILYGRWGRLSREEIAYYSRLQWAAACERRAAVAGERLRTLEVAQPSEAPG